MKIFKRIIIILLVISPLAIASASGEATPILTEPHFQLVSTSLDEFKAPLPAEVDKYRGYPNIVRQEYAFSHDSRWFALLTSHGYKERDNTLKIWNTKTGILQYEAVPFNYFDPGGMTYVKLQFTPDSTVLLVDGLLGNLITWPFLQSNTVAFSCDGHMGSDIKAVDKSNQTFTALSAEGYYLLCGVGQQEALLSFWGREQVLRDWWGEHTKILHDNKLLVIYNIRPEGESAHHGKAHPVSEVIVKVDPKWLDPWDLDYVSKAERFFTQHDPETEHFLLIESFPDQVMINLWDYGKKQWLDKQFFKGVQVSVVYAAGPYVLLQHESDFALITHQDDKLNLLWQQHFPALNVPKHKYSVSFSHDRQAIVFKLRGGAVRVDTQTGEQTLYPRLPDLKEGELLVLSPVFNYNVSQYFDPLRLTECLEHEEDSSLYSLDGKEKLQALVGGVFAISPDGKVLATCKGKELRLYRAVAAAK